MINKLIQTIKLMMYMSSQGIISLVLIWFDGMEVTNTYSEVRKPRKNKKDKAVSYLKRLYKE